MFEGWVYTLVAGYLGNYIKDIHREQFRIGLWSGVALLENAELRLEAFDYLQLPFAIKQGFVGKLRLQVPWKTLFWEPIVIALEDVYICACPHDDSEWNEEALENRALAAKKAKLAAAEITKLSSHVPDEKVRQSFLSHAFAKIIDNIQVTIRNVHIRYIDKKDDPEGSFYFGAKLAGLSIGTGDGGVSAAGKAKGGVVHKSVELSQVSVYWNSTLTKEASSSQLTTTIGHYLSRWFAKKDEELTYILYPLDASIKLTVNRSASSEGGPQYALAGSLDKLELNLTDRQVHEVVLLLESFKISRLRERYGRFRPRIGLTPEERARCHWQHLWWQYAIRAVLSDVQKRLRRTSWRYLAWRLECRRRYVSLYKRKLDCFQEGKPPDDDVVDELEELEKELDMETILSLRSLADSKCRPNGASDSDTEDSFEDSVITDRNRKPQHPRGWLSVFSFGMLGKSATMDSAAEFTGPLSDEIMKDLYKATNFHPTALSGGDPKGYSIWALSLHIKRATARMENSSTKRGLVEIGIIGVYTSFRKLQDVATAAVAVKTFEVKDICSENALFPFIIMPKAANSRYASSRQRTYAEAAYAAYTANGSQNGISQRELNDASFRIDVEISEEPEMKIAIVVKPLEVVYSADILSGLLNFFHLPRRYETDEAYTASLDTAQTQHDSTTRTRLSLVMDARELVLVVPEYSTNNLFLVVSLESFHFAMSEVQGLIESSKSFTESTEALNHIKAIQNSVLDLSWAATPLHHFEVIARGLQVRIGKQQSMKGTPLSWLNVVDYFSAHANIVKYRRSSEMHWKIDGGSAAIKIALSTAICKDLKTILRSATVPIAVDRFEASSSGKHSKIQYSGQFSIAAVKLEVLLDEVKGITFHLEPLGFKFRKDYLQEDICVSVERFYMENMNASGASPRRWFFSTFTETGANGLSLTVVRSLEDLRLQMLLQGVECHVQPIFFAALSGFISSIQDDAERFQQEDRFTSQETRFSMILELNQVSALLYDTHGILATLLLPRSDFLWTSPDLTFERWQLEGKAVDITLTGPDFATQNIDGKPLSSLLSEVPSVLHLQLAQSKQPLPALEILVSLENMECILHGDYLALLIGFFCSSEWKSRRPGNSHLQARNSTIVPYKVEVTKSLLLLPIGGGSFMRIVIPEFYFSFTPSELREGCKEFYVMGKQLSLSSYGLEASVESDKYCLPLIDSLDGEIRIEPPVEGLSETTNISLKFSVINVSLVGNMFMKQCHWVEVLSNELALVGKKSTAASSIREAYATKGYCVLEAGTHKQSDTSLSLKCQVDQITFCLKSLRSAAIEAVALGEVVSATAACGIAKGMLQQFSLKLVNIKLFAGDWIGPSSLDGKPRRPNFAMINKGSCLRGKLLVALSSEATDLRVRMEPLPVLPSQKQVDVVVPCIEVWLHFTSWNKIISWIFFCFPIIPVVEDSLVDQRVADEDPQRIISSTSQLKLRATVPHLDFLLPDFNQSTSSGQKLILISSSFYVDEFEMVNSRCLFSAHITQVKAETKEKQLSGNPFVMAANFRIKGDVLLELPVPSLAFTIQVSSIDSWWSYPVLQFFSTFELEPGGEEEGLALDVSFNVKADIEMLSLLLTDGRWNYNCPLLEIIFAKASAEFTWTVANLELALSTLAEISYHNIQKVVWEPFLEPWKVSVSVLQCQRPTTWTKVEISSSSNLNINVTEALSQAITRAVEMISWSRFHETRHDLESVSRVKAFSQYAPYWFQNDTGIAVSYSLIWPSWNEERGVESDHPTTSGWRTVLPGCAVPLFMNENRDPIHQRKARWISSRVSEKKKIGLMSHRRMRIRLEGASGSSLPMSIDLVGSRVFEVNFSEREGEGSKHEKGEQENEKQNYAFATHAVFEVSLQHHSKLIRLHSTVSLANSTSVALEVRLEIPFSIAPKIMDPILPDEVVPLPVHLAETGRIRWRPYGTDYLWSEAQPLSKLISTKSKFLSQRPFVCYPSRPTSGPFRCCVSVEEKSVSGAFVPLKSTDKLQTFPEYPTGWKMWTLLLQAPFVIRNSLPRPLNVEVEGGAGVNVRAFIPEGDAVFLHEVDVVHDLGLKFIISNYFPGIVKFGRATSRDRAPSNDELLVLSPRDPHAAPISARVDKLVDSVSGARTISIYVPYWIFNCSGLDLCFVDGDAEINSGKENLLPDAYRTGEHPIPSPNGLGIQSLLEVDSACNTSTIRRDFGKIVSHLPSYRVFKSSATQATSTPCLEDGARQEVPKAHLYSPSTRVETSEHKMRLRAFDSSGAWSQAFLLDPPGGIAPIIIPQPFGKGAYVLSLTSIPAMGACSGKTKTVTFRPRFVLANASRQEICFKQQGTNVVHILPVGQNVHVHWTDLTRNLLISVRYNEHGWDWSGGFAPDRLGDTQVLVHNNWSGRKEILRVEVSNASVAGPNSIGSTNESLGTFFIIVTNDETGFMPYRIDNFSIEKLRFYQKRCEKTENILQPYSSCDYAWDEPCLPPQLVIEVPGEGTLGTYALDDVKSYPPVHFHASGQKADRRFMVSVHAEASRRVLTVVDMAIHTQKDAKLQQLRLGRDFNEAVKSRQLTSAEFTLKVASIGISLVDSTPQELVFASARGISFHLFQSHLEQSMKLEISLLQVDNQLRHATYPVLLSTATSLPKLSSSGILMKDIISSEWNPLETAFSETENPAVSMVVSKWRYRTGSVDCYQSIYLSVAPLRLELEERNLTSLLGFFKALSMGGSNMGTEKFMSFKVQPAYASGSSDVLTNLRFVEVLQPSQVHKSWPALAAVEPVKGPTQKLIVFAKQKRKVYVEAFHIEPLELTVSFSSIPWLPKESRGVAAQSLLWVTGSLLQRRLIALADVEGAPIRLRQLSLAHPMANWHSILGIIQRHYTRQLLHEVYKVLVSADVFGNPMSFMRSLGSGMWDFVSAPATSIRQNPGQIVHGVSVGTRSLFRNTVYAFSNAATQMSKAARKGMAALALDQDYIDELDIHQRDSSIVNEFLEGLTGLLQSSVRGAERHGIPGVFSGMAVGILRAVARPAASMLDVAGKTALSIRNSSRPAQQRITRLRLPRYLEEGSPLLPYSWNEALGTAVLLEADGGRLKDEVYITCQPLSECGHFVLLTDNLLLQVTSTTHEEFEVTGREWIIMSENNVEDILYIDRDEETKTLDVLFCPHDLILKETQLHVSNKSNASSSSSNLSPFRNVTLHFNSRESADELHSTLLHLLCRKQTRLLRGASLGSSANTRVTIEEDV